VGPHYFYLAAGARELRTQEGCLTVAQAFHG
jgi:hypothetical protein